jgi:hypothetical protein
MFVWLISYVLFTPMVSAYFNLNLIEDEIQFSHITYSQYINEFNPITIMIIYP